MAAQFKDIIRGIWYTMVEINKIENCDFLTYT